MSKQFDQFYFKNNIKRNKFIAFNMVDSQNTLFNVGAENKLEFAVNIEEFKERIKDFAYGCEVITTEEHIIANGGIPFTDKTTIVICDNPKHFSNTIEYKYRRNMKFIPKRDFIDCIIKHEQRRKTPLFLFVNKEISLIDLCVDVYEVAKSDRPSEGISAIKMSEDNLTSFRRFEEIKTEVSEKYEVEQTEYEAHGRKSETIINGSMKIVKKIEPTTLLGYKYSFKRYFR